jgi:hypothetical protein
MSAKRFVYVLKNADPTPKFYVGLTTEMALSQFDRPRDEVQADATKGVTPMIRRLMVAVVLVGLGWVAGRAQEVSQPEFVLELEAPQGWTTVTCSRGCELIGSRDHGNPRAGRMLQYRYGCGVGATPSDPLPAASSPLRCKATAFGWKKD